MNDTLSADIVTRDFGRSMSVAAWLGVDVGWVYPAVDSDGKIYTWARREDRQQARRGFTRAGPVTVTRADGTTHTEPAYASEQIATLIACASPKQLLTRCQGLASQIVQKAFQSCQGIALEQWSDDPRRNTRWRVMHSATMTCARHRGVPVVTVPRAYTSQTCPFCGHVSTDNRPSRNRFECTRCGQAGQADVIAALNIAARADRKQVPDPSVQVPTEAEKRCAGCCAVKPKTEYWLSTGSRDGLDSRCATCKRHDGRQGGPTQLCSGGRATRRLDARGVCPTCGHLFAVGRDGRVWRHHARPSTNHFAAG